MIKNYIFGVTVAMLAAAGVAQGAGAVAVAQTVTEADLVRALKIGQASFLTDNFRGKTLVGVEGFGGQIKSFDISSGVVFVHLKSVHRLITERQQVYALTLNSGLSLENNEIIGVSRYAPYTAAAVAAAGAAYRYRKPIATKLKQCTNWLGCKIDHLALALVRSWEFAVE